MNKDRIFRIGTSSECEIVVLNGNPSNAVWAQLVVTDQGMHQFTVVEPSVRCLVNGNAIEKQYWVNEQDTLEIDGRTLNWEYIRGNSNDPFVPKFGHKKLVVMGIVLSAVLLAFGIVAFFVFLIKPLPPSASELYSDTCTLLSSVSPDDYQKGYDRLEKLATDSLYIPAVLKYYDIVLTDRDTSRWNQAFANMMSISNKSPEAAYECALCLSYMSPKLTLPEVKKYDFVTEKDYKKAIRLFEFASRGKINDYKTPFWQLINMITLNNDRNLSEADAQRMRLLYDILNRNLEEAVDEDVALYRRETDRIICTILKNWHIID